MFSVSMMSATVASLLCLVGLLIPTTVVARVEASWQLIPAQLVNSPVAVSCNEHHLEVYASQSGTAIRLVYVPGPPADDGTLTFEIWDYLGTSSQNAYSAVAHRGSRPWVDTAISDGDVNVIVHSLRTRPNRGKPSPLRFVKVHSSSPLGQKVQYHTPEIVALEDYQSIVFIRAVDSSVQFKAGKGRNWPAKHWTKIGGSVVLEPSAVRTSNGNVFVLGVDDCGFIVTASLTPEDIKQGVNEKEILKEFHRTKFRALGTPAVTAFRDGFAMAFLSQKTGRLHCVIYKVTGTTMKIVTTKQFGFIPKTNPGIATLNSKNLDLFATGPDAELIRLSWSPTKVVNGVKRMEWKKEFFYPSSLGIRYAPAVTARRGKYDVFVTEINGDLLYKAFEPTAPISIPKTSEGSGNEGQMD